MFRSGRIPESQGDTWKDIDLALRIGARGLRPGRSLPQLLAKRRGARNLPGTPPLTEALILKWADRCFRRTGQWPRFNSGEVPGRTGETWAAVDAALRDGTRGLPGSHIVFTPKEEGVYRITATSFEQRGRGAYTLTIRAIAGK